MRDYIVFRSSDPIDQIIEEKLRIKALRKVRREPVATETQVSQETSQDVSHKTFTITDTQKLYLTENTHKSKDLYTELEELLKNPPNKLKNLNRKLINVINNLVTVVSLGEFDKHFDFPIDPDLISSTVEKLGDIVEKIQVKSKSLDKEHEKISTDVFGVLSLHWEKVGKFLSSKS